MEYKSFKSNNLRWDSYFRSKHDSLRRLQLWIIQEMKTYVSTYLCSNKIEDESTLNMNVAKSDRNADSSMHSPDEMFTGNWRLPIIRANRSFLFKTRVCARQIDWHAVFVWEMLLFVESICVVLQLPHFTTFQQIFDPLSFILSLLPPRFMIFAFFIHLSSFLYIFFFSSKVFVSHDYYFWFVSFLTNKL